MSRGTSPDFGRWVKTNREALGLNQRDLADAIGVSQQACSLMERQGKIPSQVVLERVCQVLRKDFAEALGLTRRIDLTTDRLRVYGRTVEQFRRHLIQLANSNDSVDVYHICEDLRPVDYALIEWHRGILSLAANIKSTLLFRFSSPEYANEATLLAREVSHDIDQPHGKRIRAFFRHPDHAENPSSSLPLFGESVTPMLIMAHGGVELFNKQRDVALITELIGKGKTPVNARMTSSPGG
jgi:transcriptional regulator with XRE-family HTH domain